MWRWGCRGLEIIQRAGGPVLKPGYGNAAIKEMDTKIFGICKLCQIIISKEYTIAEAGKR